MKNKLLLPVLAVIFAVAGAFATPLFVQTGWYDSNGAASGGGLEGTITDPPGDTPVCSTSAISHQCMIVTSEDEFDAYNTKENAESANPVGLLKYND
jgi:hypothetical protein